MIKLNNKNITYVALADSANSIKAPKEIWYADSNNSVKLVYRRKDALIEGEDYEKYHWLEGRNGAYINTEYYPIVGTDIFSVHFHYDGTLRNPDGTEQNAFGATITNGRLSAYINGNNFLSCNYCHVENSYFPSTNKYSLDWDISNLRIDGENFKYDANNDSYSFSNKEIPTVTGNRTLYVFSCNQSANTYLHGDISSFKITDTSSNTKMNLTPCKLLKPIPKWLDANGIRRQVGECGMIDLVSGKFYGNVNSVGTFTVENYYERKEWLVARIYETTGVNPMCDLPINSDTFEFRVIMQSENPINIGHIKNPNYWYFSDNLTNIKVWNTVNRTTNFTSNIGSNDMTFKSTSSEFTINNIQVTKYGFPAKYKTFFNNRTNGDAIVYNSPITVDGVERYIPCILTMDLPASMDANNIARTKGTSGMWDLVSDRFYGNVASSGTFKAVNLAEGVDYEVHDWLVGDGSAYIDTLTALSDSDTIQMKITGGTLPSASQAYKLIFGNNTTSYNYNTLVLFVDYLLAIRPTKTSSYDEKRVPIDLNKEYSIVQSTTSVTINGDEVWSGTSAYTEISDNCRLFTSGTNDTHCYDGQIAYLKISNKLNLIPVKLLRSIPSKYDANGIARNAGECGMYDTVNDVFYGNVASSGTFSVSDDS